jgi:hypothetical protein
MRREEMRVNRCASTFEGVGAERRVVVDDDQRKIRGR